MPRAAPQPAAGTAFTLWRLAPDGQRALTSLGYPPLLQGGDLAGSWLTRQGTGTVPADLRFAPTTLPWPIDVVYLGYVVTAALSVLDGKQRLAALKPIEADANARLTETAPLSGGACLGRWLSVLRGGGVAAIPGWLSRQAT